MSRFVIALSVLFAWPALAAPTRNLEIYATTDLHGHLEAEDVRLSGPGPARFSARGGLAIIAGYLANARAHYPGRMLLVDGGDMMQGTLASNLFEGATMIRGLNLLGYAAVALGNHEFDYGPIGPAATPATPKDDPRGALHARLREARFPVLAANLVTPAGEKLVAPYTITKLDGVPVGIIGGTSESLFETTQRKNLIGLHVEPLGESIVRAAKEASQHGARVLVVVVHAGGECDRAPHAIDSAAPGDLAGCRTDEEVIALARALALSARCGGPTVSAIVGGHTHQAVTMVSDGIPIIQAGKNGHNLAHISIEVAGSGDDAKPTGKYSIEAAIDVCARFGTNGCARTDEHDTRPADYLGVVTPDHAVEAALGSDLEKAHAISARKIGVLLPEGLLAAYGRESALGNYTADALRRAGKSDAAFVNGGGLRADLPPGPLTYGSLYQSFPFENEVVVVPMTGAVLQRMVLRNLTSHYGSLSYSGFHVHADCAGVTHRAVITFDDGRLLDPSVTYQVATLDFLLTGGDSALSPVPTPEKSVGVIRDVVEAAFHAHGGELRASEPGLFDKAHPRVVMPGERPLRCDKRGKE